MVDSTASTTVSSEDVGSEPGVDSHSSQCCGWVVGAVLVGVLIIILGVLFVLFTCRFGKQQEHKQSAGIAYMSSDEEA